MVVGFIPKSNLLSARLLFLLFLLLYPLVVACDLLLFWSLSCCFIPGTFGVLIIVFVVFVVAFWWYYLVVIVLLLVLQVDIGTMGWSSIGCMGILLCPDPCLFF